VGSVNLLSEKHVKEWGSLLAATEETGWLAELRSELSSWGIPVPEIADEKHSAMDPDSVTYSSWDSSSGYWIFAKTKSDIAEVRSLLQSASTRPSISSAWASRTISDGLGTPTVYSWNNQTIWESTQGALRHATAPTTSDELVLAQIDSGGSGIGIEAGRPQFDPQQQTPVVVFGRCPQSRNYYWIVRTWFVHAGPASPFPKEDPQQIAAFIRTASWASWATASQAPVAVAPGRPDYHRFELSIYPLLLADDEQKFLHSSRELLDAASVAIIGLFYLGLAARAKWRQW
jgi:hypothetical protein